MNKTIKYRDLSQGIEKPSFDYSNPMEDVFIEVPPYSVDLETGDLLNKTPYPILKKVGQRNVDDIIQSYAYDCDIYKILEKVAISGDYSLLNVRPGSYGDYLNLPDNLNDLNNYCNNLVAKNSNVDPGVIKAAINEALTGDELKAVISKLVENQINKNVKVEVPANE